MQKGTRHNMKDKIKTITAFTVLGILIITTIVLTLSDRSTDVYPNDSTRINLYGEAHGSKTYYDIEFNLWKEYYGQGYRDLFLELPYYSAEFLNLWMQADSDELIDQFFEEIQGTQSGNAYYNEFFHEIKKFCPKTVFHGTDVGHQYQTTGARYLKYLEENGLQDSENYARAEECIRQGQEFYADDTAHNGISAIRESYMVENFISFYPGGRVMGIYGSYHTQLDNADLMAGRLKAHFGDVISSVKLSSVAFGRNTDPYRLGFCVSGLIFLLMLTIPNMVWAKRAKPKDYEKYVVNENRILLMLERIGEVVVTVGLIVFTALNPHVKMLPEGLYFEWKILFWITGFLLMILYECYWIKYFRSDRTMKDFYASFAGFPVAGATLPVIAVFLLGLYAGNLVMIGASIVLGIGHIGIHWMHLKEIGN